MVSEKVITPATWTETARNLATNPSFEATVGAVETRRNITPNPRMRTLAEWTFAAPAVATVTETSAGLRVDYTGSQASNSHIIYQLFTMPIVGGDAISGSYEIEVPLGYPAVSFQVRTNSYPTALATSVGPATTVNPGETKTLVTAPLTAAATENAARVILQTNGTMPAGARFFVRNSLTERAPVPGPYFDGGFSPDADLAPAWTAGADASPSTLTGVRIANLTLPSVSQALEAYATKQSPYGRTQSARFFLLHSAAIGIPVSDFPPTPGMVYTLLARVRPNARDTAVRPRIGASTEGATITLPAGQWTEVRAVQTAASSSVLSTGFFVAADPSRVFGDTLDVDDVMIVEGVYTGPYIDGSMFSTDRKRYSWLGEPDASISIEEVMTAPAVAEPVFEVVTLTTTNDEIVFHAEPTKTGFVYDNETLQRWYNPAKIAASVDKRPNAHGAYGLGQLFTEEHRPLITGQYYGTSSADAKRARERLVSAFSEGFPVSIAVTDEEDVTTRRAAWLVDYDAPFDADFAHFTFDIEFIAPDPRRYGATESSSTGLPTPGSGLVWNLGTAPSGLYFDWGTAGSLGQLSVTNGGGAATNPRIEVGGAGAFLAGFRVTEIETGRELTLERPTDFGDVVVLDSRTQRATLNGGDISRFLTSRDWFEIPAGATRRYQINPLGATSGAPTMTIYTASASL